MTPEDDNTSDRPLRQPGLRVMDDTEIAQAARLLADPTPCLPGRSKWIAMLIDTIRVALVEAEKHHSARAAAEDSRYMAMAWSDRAAHDRRAIIAINILEQVLTQ